ncbi:MAG: GAF domain-containing protein [Leptolyngbya sp.]|nr:GAF domain-containing protein [Leptolyngbya sp.]
MVTDAVFSSIGYPPDDNRGGDEEALVPSLEGTVWVAPEGSPRLTSEGATPDWFNLLQHHSQLVMAVVEVGTRLNGVPQAHRIVFANDYFIRLTGLSPTDQPMPIGNLTWLTPSVSRALRHRFRLHFLQALLTKLYGVGDWVTPRLRHEPLMVSLTHPETEQIRHIELRLRTTELGLQVLALDPELEDSLRRCWPSAPTPATVTTQLLTKGSPLNHLILQLHPHRYAIQGQVLVEGTDVTERETSRALIHLLAGRESVVGTEQFLRANTLMKQLFGAQDGFLLIAENDQAQLWTELDKPDWHNQTYTLGELQGSSFLQATGRGEVITIPDLNLACPTPAEQTLAAAGVRSLLLIPLVMRNFSAGPAIGPMFGLVGLTSTKPYAFNQSDCSLATTLIPALNASIRHSVRDRFVNIHPSVRWRFEQEAERLSLGLPPAPIVFENVYPLYGISDIRGSSDERNRAIQQDLLAQFRLALAVVETVRSSTIHNALIEQLWLDVQDRMADLEQGVTVEAEVTLLRYLNSEVEAHFPYFTQTCPAANEAIRRYQQAVDSDHGCVYSARAAYDQTIGYINSLLRDTWTRWQQSMQAITPHYCDLEATDGIDHMIYTGKAIDPNFTDFQLKALRYEQLRAMCDCARQGLALKETHQTNMGITHLVLVQMVTVDIVHDETTERLFDVRGTRDTRYEIVKKRIDKARDVVTQDRITQPGRLTIVYSTTEEWEEYQQYLRYLHREGFVGNAIEEGHVEPLQGVSGLKFARVEVLPGLATPLLPSQGSPELGQASVADGP